MRASGGRKLPGFTKCYNVISGSASLTDERVFRALFVFVVLGLLGLAHIYIRFSVREMKLQHKEYQQVYLELRQQANRIQRENETLCDISRLHDFGLKELRMVDTQPASVSRAALPEVVRTKYLPAGLDSDSGVREIAVVRREAEAPAKPLQRIAGRLFEPDRAYAGEQRRHY